jgi:hypothetical protein
MDHSLKRKLPRPNELLLKLSSTCITMEFANVYNIAAFEFLDSLSAHRRVVGRVTQ